jgi:2-polyprenyl-6-methoxyphenol hydroxylase-like FAD-dependent oxidoreductase
MKNVDIVISGAGPVGLMSAYLAQLCGMSTLIVDKSEAPLQVGRADALNARTLQLLEVAGFFTDLYPLGLPCNTSSIFKDGKIISRQSSWWEDLEGCMHKHFLMLGQSFVEKAVDEKLTLLDAGVLRKTSLEDVQLLEDGCVSTLSNGEIVKSSYVIGADGSRSMIRNKFEIPFEVTRPEIIWAVIDGVIETDFEQAPEIIIFQNETSDVAWIPREGNLDRFYIRMDKKEFKVEEAIQKITDALSPYTISFKEIIWFSQFTVKESVAEKFSINERVFLAGDSCHIHSVNGGQGLNTGLADAFNLIWKLNMVKNHGATESTLKSYESERKPVALSVIDSSGELVRSTKYSDKGTHAEDYLKIVEKRAGNITGMGIRYGDEGLAGSRVHDFELEDGKRLYSLFDYSKYTRLISGNLQEDKTQEQPGYVNTIRIPNSINNPYNDQVVLIRPDSYIESVESL